MKRLALGLALAMALFGTTLTGTALAQQFDPQQGTRESWRNDQTPGNDEGYGGRRDDNGYGGQGGGWGHRRSSANFEGRWVADNRSAGFRGRGGQQGVLLPGFIRIDQNPNVLRIADSQNRLVERILISRRFNPGDNGFDQIVGHWRGSTLEVEQNGPRGARITQTFSLQNRGRTLMVTTRREGIGRRPAVEFTSTYHRA